MSETKSGETVTASKPSYVRKITIGSIYPNVKPDDGTFARVWGEIQSYKMEMSKLDDRVYARFFGVFRAVTKDGQKFVSRNMILPPVCEEPVIIGLPPELEQGKTKSADAAGKSADSADKLEAASYYFGLEIGVQRDDKPNSAKGYKFTCQLLKTPGSDFDPLAGLERELSSMGALSSSVPALAISAPEVKTETAVSTPKTAGKSQHSAGKRHGGDD